MSKVEFTAKLQFKDHRCDTMNDNSSWYKKCCSIALVCEIVPSNQFKQTYVTQKLTFSAKHSLDVLRQQTMRMEDDMPLQILAVKKQNKMHAWIKTSFFKVIKVAQHVSSENVIKCPNIWCQYGFVRISMENILTIKYVCKAISQLGWQL